MPDPTDDASSHSQVRALVEVAARLLRENGPGAVTTRAIARAAGVRAPTIYRHFGDKNGLLDAVAEHEMAAFVAAKSVSAAAARAGGIDPVADLHAGWCDYIEFGVTHPALFSWLHDPDRPTPTPATERGLDVLRSRVHALAKVGLLRASEQQALQHLRAGSDGAVLTLLTTPPHERAPHLADAVYDAVTSAILADAPARIEHQPLRSAVALRAAAPDLPGLSDIERALLGEWLDRAIAALQHQTPETTAT